MDGIKDVLVISLGIRLISKSGRWYVDTYSCYVGKW